MRCVAFICLWLIVGGILANVGIVALALLAGFCTLISPFLIAFHILGLWSGE
jgi:hypothetical protein